MEGRCNLNLFLFFGMFETIIDFDALKLLKLEPAADDNIYQTVILL